MYNYKNKKGNVQRELDILLSKTLSMFKYEGLPETLPQRELERQLQMKGYAFVTKYKGDLYSFTDGLGGEPDPYGNPTQIVIANPALKFNKTLDLKDDGVLVKNDSMMNGLRHLLTKYVTMMNESEVTMVVNSFNARYPTLLSAGDDKTKESAEAYLRQIQAGELGVIAENRLFEGINVQQTGGQGSIFTQLIEYQQYLKATLYNELGLEMNNNMKRERLTQDEVNMTDIIYPFIDNMLTQREEAVEAINKKYDTEITVGFDSIWAKHAPSDAWDDEAFYEELDMYLDMFMGQTEEQMPVEEDVLPDISEEELLDILAQLEAISEEGKHASNDEDDDSQAGGGHSTTVTIGELEDLSEGGGGSKPSGGTRTDDTEPGDDNVGPSDESDTGSTGHDAGGGSDTETDAGDSPTTENNNDEPDEHELTVELVVTTGQSDNEDSGTHGELPNDDETEPHEPDETFESRAGDRTGGTSVDITIDVTEEEIDEIEHNDIAVESEDSRMEDESNEESNVEEEEEEEDDES